MVMNNTFLRNYVVVKYSKMYVYIYIFIINSRSARFAWS